MVHRSRLALLCLASCLSLAASACGGGSGPAAGKAPGGGPAASTTTAPEKVNLAWVAVTGSQAPAWITQEGGYFAKNGLDVNLEYVQGSPTAAAALVGGSVQFVTMAGPAVVSADLKGAHEVVVMGFVTKPVFVLMTKPGITSPDQLKGKTVGVSKVGSSDDFMLREALSHWGLKPGSGPGQVRITGVGSVGAQVAAMKQGLIDGLVVDPPNDVLAGAAGAHLRARIADLGIPYEANSLVTTREYIQQHPDVVEKVVRAFVEGLHRFKTDKPFAEKVIGQYLKSKDPKVIDATYDAFVDVFPQVPAPSKAGMEEIVKENQATGKAKGTVDVNAMLDDSFVQKLQQSGFIAQVYGKK